MSFMYKCPLCNSLHKDIYDAKACRDTCARDEYPVVAVDSVEEAKVDPTEFVGKCGTCRNSDVYGHTFADCPRSGHREVTDGCDSYEPDTITFGTGIETLWNEQRGTV